MASAGARLIGISEVGHDDSGDVPWGNTQQQGVLLQLTTETVDLMSGQAKMKEDVNLVQAAMQLQIGLVTANLEVFQRIWGLPDAALTGSLPGSNEVLTFTEGNTGTQERPLYVLGIGAVSTRRIDAIRCRVTDLGEMNFASNGYMLPNATWEVLNPLAGDPLVITDAM